MKYTIDDYIKENDFNKKSKMKVLGVILNLMVILSFIAIFLTVFNLLSSAISINEVEDCNDGINTSHCSNLLEITLYEMHYEVSKKHFILSFMFLIILAVGLITATKINPKLIEDEETLNINDELRLKYMGRYKQFLKEKKELEEKLWRIIENGKDN